jgi:peptidoglycan hydrolase-like protein with peptidoglycan-binding domain
LAAAPANLQGTPEIASINLVVDTLPNATSGSSGYYFYTSNANSGWIQTNNWLQSGLSCNTPYTYYVKYRNGDGIETATTSVEITTSPCIYAPAVIISWMSTVTTTVATTKDTDITKFTVAELQERIKQITSQIEALQQAKAFAMSQALDGCLFNEYLKYGASGKEVECLQIFLKSQGADIYPEGIVSGWFGPKTKAAVIHFQEKHFNEILLPWGFKNGTGIVGNTTRAKINKILGR